MRITPHRTLLSTTTQSLSRSAEVLKTSALFSDKVADTPPPDLPRRLATHSYSVY